VKVSAEASTRVKEQLGALADASIIVRIERRASAHLVRCYNVPTYVRTPRIHLDPADWRAGFLAIEERTLPQQLYRDLEELTPQALLRDLSRLPYRVDRFERDLSCEPLDPGGRRALKEGKAALVRDPMPVVEPTVRAVAAEQRRRHRFVRDTWLPIRGDDEPRRQIEEYIEPSLGHRNY
jgi:hypothetical protein